MKTLYLIRHAEAAGVAPGIEDIDRPLTSNGKESVEMLAELCKDEIKIPDIFLSSPALRAVETASIFAKGIGYPEERIMTDKIIYEGPSIEPILKLIQRTNDQLNTLALFGHNPIFSHLGAALSSTFNESMPKASILGLEFKGQMWKNISLGKGSIALYKYI